MNKSLFISHSSKDSGQAARLTAALESAGFTCWLAPRDIPGGAHYDEAILDAIDGCQALLVLLSSRSNESVHVKHEIERAQRLDKPLVPVRLEDVEPARRLAFHLSTSQWIDLRDDTFDVGLRALVASLSQLPITAGPRVRDDDPIDHGLAQRNRIEAILRLKDHPQSRVTELRRDYSPELVLMLQEVCCNLSRFRHARDDGEPMHAVRINQEVRLDGPGAFADIQVCPARGECYFIEVKFGYTSMEILECFRRKHDRDDAAVRNRRVILVVDLVGRTDWPETRLALESMLRDGPALEVWDEQKLLNEIQEYFDAAVDFGAPDCGRDLKEVQEAAKGRYAFGAGWTGSLAQSNLLWYLGFWRVRELLDGGLDEGQGLQTTKYERVVTLIADMCSFRSYMRDTGNEHVVRHELISFYMKSRYAILNAGGLAYSFAGDQVIAFFGIPDCQEGYTTEALRCARALLDIGNSVSSHWQRHLDRVQTHAGVRIGMALGDVQVVPLRPFEGTRLSAVSETVNVALSLLSIARPSDVMINNTYFNQLDGVVQSLFEHVAESEARPLGNIRCYRGRFLN